MLLPILFTISTLDALSFSMIISTMNPYVYSLGGTQFYLGVLGSVSALINLIWNPIVGSLGDSLGRKKVLLQCIMVCLIGNVIAAFTSSLTMFFISRIFATFGTQIVPLLKALMDDNIKEKENKMAAINKMQALGGACFIFGSLATGYLSEYESGYKMVFYLISGMFALNFGLVCLISDTQQIKKEKPQTSFNFTNEIRNAATNLTKVNWPKYWDLFTLKLIVDFVLTIFHFNLVAILMTQFGITGKSFGYVFASIGVTGIITSLIMSKVQKYFYAGDESGLKRLLHGCLFLIYTCLGQSLSTTFVLYYIHLIPISVGRVLFETTFTEVILARAGPDEKGSIMGTFETTLPLAGLTAPLISGILSDTYGSNAPILFCIAPLLFGTVVAYSQRNKSKIS